MTSTAAAPPDPCILVIFGASGDLTRRKLIPALYELSRPGPHGTLPQRFAIVGVARTEMSDDDFRRVREGVQCTPVYYDWAFAAWQKGDWLCH